MGAVNKLSIYKIGIAAFVLSELCSASGAHAQQAVLAQPSATISQNSVPCGQNGVPAMQQVAGQNSVLPAGVPAYAVKKWSGPDAITPEQAKSLDEEVNKPVFKTPKGCSQQVNAAPVTAAPIVTQVATQPQPQTPPAQIPGPPGPPAPFKQSGFVEAGGSYSSLTHHEGNWHSQYFKGEVQSGPSDRWNAQVLNGHEFHDDGVFLGLGELHDFDDKWYSSISAGTSTDGFFLPRYRVDASINRKWLDTNQLVTTLGVGEYKARDAHENQSLFVGAAYYFQDPWIIQGGITFNNSTPGSVYSTYEFIAVTQGTQKDYLLTLLYGFGKEAYQVIGPQTSISDFHSQAVSLELRKWVAEDWGFTTRGEFYHNPTYNRTGMTLGVFHDF